MLNCSPSGVSPAVIRARLSSGFWHTADVHATKNHKTTSRMTSSSLRTLQLVMYGVLCAVRDRNTFSTLSEG